MQVHTYIHKIIKVLLSEKTLSVVDIHACTCTYRAIYIHMYMYNVPTFISIHVIWFTLKSDFAQH